MKRSPMPRGTKPLERKTGLARSEGPKRKTWLSSGGKAQERKTAGKKSKSRPKTAPDSAIDLVKDRAKDDVAGLCEIGLICTGRAEATQTAHRRGKGSGGVGPKNTTANTPSNLLRGCAVCHDRIDNAEVADAERLGLKIRHTLALPSEVPVHLHNLNGWVLLDDEGGYRSAPAASYGRPEGVLPVITIDPYEHEFGDEGVVFDGVDRWGHVDCGGWSYEVDGPCECHCGTVLFIVAVTE